MKRFAGIQKNPKKPQKDDFKDELGDHFQNYTHPYKVSWLLHSVIWKLLHLCTVESCYAVDRTTLCLWANWMPLSKILVVCLVINLSLCHCHNMFDLGPCAIYVYHILRCL